MEKPGGKTVVLKVANQFEITWDGLKSIESQLHDSQHGKLCGLLGDADGDISNDLSMPDGKVTDDLVEFGDSWQVPGRYSD